MIAHSRLPLIMIAAVVPMATLAGNFGLPLLVVVTALLLVAARVAVRAMTDFDLIFDSAGGITLQTADYCRYFCGREADAAKCVSDLLEPGATPECWDGNEPEHRIEHLYEVERRGSHRIIRGRDVLKAVGQLKDREGWLNSIGDDVEREFFKALFQLREPARPLPLKWQYIQSIIYAALIVLIVIFFVVFGNRVF